MNRHYFNLDDDILQEIIDGWNPDAELFADELAPICCDAETDKSATSFVAA